MAPGSCFAIFGAIRFLQTARKPNSVLDDHSSRRRITAALEQPTRGFRLPSSFRSQAPFAMAHRASTPLPHEGLRRSPCLFGLAPCGVYIAATVTSRAVRSYRTFSPLPPPCDFESLGEAVCFLLHWPSGWLEPSVPDVIRHTALRSSDFPLPLDRLRDERQRSPGRLHGSSLTYRKNDLDILAIKSLDSKGCRWVLSAKY
jgi:hypothetical protein